MRDDKHATLARRRIVGSGARSWSASANCWAVCDLNYAVRQADGPLQRSEGPVIRCMQLRNHPEQSVPGHLWPCTLPAARRVLLQTAPRFELSHMEYDLVAAGWRLRTRPRLSENGKTVTGDESIRYGTAKKFLRPRFSVLLSHHDAWLSPAAGGIWA